MSASLLVAVPFALFGIVLLLCFVGCDRVFGVYAVNPPPPPFTRYSEVILGEPTLVAYWPLGEQAGETTAVDLKGGPTEHISVRPFPTIRRFPRQQRRAR